MPEVLNSIQDKLSELSAHTPDLAKNALIGAGAGGAAASLLSSQRRIPGELKKERRKRILRDSLIGAALSGSAVGLAQYGVGNLNTAAPVTDTPVTVGSLKKAPQDPLARLFMSGAAAAGASKLDTRRKSEMASVILGDSSKALAKEVENLPVKEQIRRLRGLTSGKGDVSDMLRARLKDPRATSYAKTLGVLTHKGKNAKLLKALSHMKRNKAGYIAATAGLAIPEIYRAGKGVLSQMFTENEG